MAGKARGTTDTLAAALAELRGIYAQVDAALHGFGCDASTDCCRFGVTGREPYPTAVEVAELERAVRARGGLPKRRTLPVARERRCGLLSDAGRCLVYASRPFGCRTFFCDRARGPVGETADEVPRATINALARDVASLSDRAHAAGAFAGGPTREAGPRPLSRVLEAPPWESRGR